MNTNALKRFASSARTKLMDGVSSRLYSVGFDKDGSVRISPRQVDNAVYFDGQIIYDSQFINRWEALRKRIEDHGVKNVIEEAAYTWFNRLVAIRILVRNSLAHAVLDYENPDIPLPRIVTDARAGKLPAMSEQEKEALSKVIGDGRLAFEQFSILIRAYCENNAIISNCFGGITGYTSLLLPTDILAKDNFIDMLNHTDEFISEEDWAKPELIGWLYQFYISEKKDEVFAKKGGYDSSEIPAATQIFTPNWIVKYMVQNTLGRIYLDNNPDSELGKQWKYLVAPATPAPEKSVLKYESLESLKCADLSCGSGHILNEMFDLLMQLYAEDFYSPREAVEAIFTKNIVGVDIDIRAKQLAQFALLLKACQFDSAFADCHCMPRVLSFPEPYEGTEQQLRKDLRDFLGGCDPSVEDELVEAINLFDKAQVLGTIMNFNLKEDIILMIETMLSSPSCIVDWSDESAQRLLPFFNFLYLLSLKYDTICMNPPYMSPSKVKELKEYTNKHYPNSKTDLFAVFMEVAVNRLKNCGKYSMINLPSWLFLSSFEKLREDIINNYHIDSLIHMGRGIFGIDWGSTAFVVTKDKINTNGTYFRLHERNFQHIYYYHIGELFTIVLNNHDFRYNFDNYREDGEVAADFSFVYTQDGRQLYYEIDQNKFKQIPASPIGYWVSNKIFTLFRDKKIGDFSTVITGMSLGKNELYLRLWHEVEIQKITFDRMDINSINFGIKPYLPYCKGGSRRQWFGNHEYVVNWSMKENFNRPRTTFAKYYLKEALTWPFIASGTFSARFLPKGSLWDVAGCPCFFDNSNLQFYTLGFMSSKVSRIFLPILNPTINIQVVDITNLPLILSSKELTEQIVKQVRENISISKEDWDAHETSWDFECSPLLAAIKDCRGNVADLDSLDVDEQEEIKALLPNVFDDSSLEACYNTYKSKWERLFHNLHRNEEELNRKFIDIYGLQEELTPEVPLNEITILQQGEISIEKEDTITDDGSHILMIDGIKPLIIKIPEEKIVWHPDIVIKQFISYAVGCMMGRYRLDRPGLAIAYPNPTTEEVAEYVVPQTGEKWWIDDDGIIPMIGEESIFSDEAYLRFREFLRVTLGNEKLQENMNFVRDSLGKDVADYFRNDFYADHKKMYQNRPIYWMFSSNPKGKRAAFQCLVYMHRMDRFTPEHVRTDYLLPYIDHLAAEEADLMGKQSLSAKENKRLKQIKADLEECRDYQLRLHNFADQQLEIDLDDGVVKNYALFSDILAKLK